MKKTTTILFCIFVVVGFAMGQKGPLNQFSKQAPFILGEVEKIKSVELGETRTLNIYLPEGYNKDSSATYPVIYLLDGSSNEDFIHIVGIVQFLTMIKEMPKSIVVGIANVDRRRDFTFPTTIEKDKKDYPTTGGSTKFIAFIENELQPFIQKHYKTYNSKTIIGQSLGGLLATEILLKKPNLFNCYIIVSPSLWWDNESLLSKSKNLLEKQSNQKFTAYISVGNEGEQMEGDAKHLIENLQNSGNLNMLITFLPLPNENHLTILHNSVYHAFEAIYNKAKMPDH
jgi:predicted alpha/beta superfamily hydrolase